MKFSKKNLFVVGLTVVVCAAVYVNWRMTSPTVPTGTDDVSSQIQDDKVLGQAQLVDNQNVTDNTYFQQARVERQKSREEAATVLKELYENENSDKQQKTTAQAGLLKIAGDIEKEATIETLVKAKGFTECVAVIGDNSVNVIVKTSGLKENEATIIKEIAENETKITANNIKIIEIK
ncbi:MAG: SpoIIIAH-like family protein [Ruminococcaceae bacterium]|nr:SpoIIIAH-like family protein [Oscillospiraceae bacterium]